MIGPSFFHLFLPIYKENKYDMNENIPIMNPNKSSNGIELMNYLIHKDRKRGEEIYEDENKKMDPNFYLENSKNFYLAATIL